MEDKNSGASSQNYDDRTMNSGKAKLSKDKMLEQWKHFLDSQFSETTMEHKDDIVLIEVEKLYGSVLKTLTSSQYFFYPDVTKEIEQIKKQWDLPSRNKNNNVKLFSRVAKLSHAIQKKNLENKQRKEDLETKINSSFDSMWKSECQTLKFIVEMVAPAPVEAKLTPDCQKLYNHYFDSLIQNITSSKSPACDQEFQRECRELLWNKTEAVCIAVKFIGSLIHEYSQTMTLILEKHVCFPIESDFTQVHENTLLCSYNKLDGETPCRDFQTVWNRLDDLAKSMFLEYEKKFRLQNHESRREQAEIAEKAKDFALTKYNNFMNKATSQGSGVFKKSDILRFHNEAYQKIKTCFTEIPGFKYTLSWEKSWGKLDKELKELEKSNLDKNEQKIEKLKLQIKISMVAAENEYRRFMNNSILLRSHEKSIELTELESFHEEGVKKALELYGEKMDGVQEDMKKYKETLISKFLDIRKQLMIENAEKVAREIKVKEERKVKQREQQQQRKRQKERELQKEERDSQQQKPPQFHDISKIPIQNSPFNNNQENSISKASGSTSSTSEFKGGIAIHFSTEGISIGSTTFLNGEKFTVIAASLPAVIGFTPAQILIGFEATALSTSNSHSHIVKFSLFDLLESQKIDTQRVMIKGKSDRLQPEEILAIFFHKLVHVIQNVHANFNPSRSFVEFVISPFLPLSMKQKLKIALNLAGFDSTRTHILQSTMAMALSYFHKNPQMLRQQPATASRVEKPCSIVVIHVSDDCTDIALITGHNHEIKSLLQTGRPYLKNPYSSNIGATSRYLGYFHPIDVRITRGKSLEQLLQTIVNSSKFLPENLDRVILVGNSEHVDKKIGQVAQTVFRKEVQVINHVDGILEGAAALAGWKAGSRDLFSPKLDIQEIQPYHLTFNFRSTNGSPDFEFRIINRHEPFINGRYINFVQIPLDLSCFKRECHVSEDTDLQRLPIAYYSIDEETRAGRLCIRFEISLEGHIEVEWAEGNNCHIKAEHRWLNYEEQERADTKLKSIFSTFTGSHSSSVTTQASSFSTSSSVSTSATVQTSASKGSSTANVHATVANSGESEELRQSKNELKSHVQEVKSQLEKSQGTSKLVRDQIKELLQEIYKVLNGSEPVEAALLKSYGEKLKIRAKRIK